MRKIRLASLTLLVTTLIVGTSVAPALATEVSAPTTPTVYEILAANPGGKIINEHTISWQDGTVVLTLEGGRSARAVGSCATGSFCAYNGTNLTGSRLAFSSCDATFSTASLPSGVKSVANARSGGYVQGQNSSSLTLMSVFANSSANAPSGVVKLRCFS